MTGRLRSVSHLQTRLVKNVLEQNRRERDFAILVQTATRAPFPQGGHNVGSFALHRSFADHRQEDVGQGPESEHRVGFALGGVRRRRQDDRERTRSRRRERQQASEIERRETLRRWPRRQQLVDDGRVGIGWRRSRRLGVRQCGEEVCNEAVQCGKVRRRQREGRRFWRGRELVRQLLKLPAKRRQVRLCEREESLLRTSMTGQPFVSIFALMPKIRSHAARDLLLGPRAQPGPTSVHRLGKRAMSVEARARIQLVSRDPQDNSPVNGSPEKPDEAGGPANAFG